MTPILVVVEGLDATGKTTLVRRLAAAIGAETLSTPPADIRSFRVDLDAAYRSSPLAGQLFYASTVACASDRARALLSRGRSVVVDRYWISTRAYDLMRGGVALPHVERRLLPATITLLLETDEAERRRRLEQRGATPADIAALEHADALRERFRSLLSLPVAGRGTIVDTTSGGEDAAAALAVRAIERVCGTGREAIDAR